MGFPHVAVTFGVWTYLAPWKSIVTTSSRVESGDPHYGGVFAASMPLMMPDVRTAGQQQLPLT